MVRRGKGGLSQGQHSQGLPGGEICSRKVGCPSEELLDTILTSRVPKKEWPRKNGLSALEESALHPGLIPSIRGGQLKAWGCREPSTPPVPFCTHSNRLPQPQPKTQGHPEGMTGTSRARPAPAAGSLVHGAGSRPSLVGGEGSGHPVAPGRASCQAGLRVQWTPRTCLSDESPAFTRVWGLNGNIITI